MRNPLRRRVLGIAAWLAVSAAGCVVLARAELAHLRDAFETDARIVHRLLSQRAVQHDAVLAMLALLQPSDPDLAAERRLPSVYPQIIGVQRRDAGQAWPDPRLKAAEDASRSQGHAALAYLDFAAGRSQLVLSSLPASFALQVDLRAAVPWAEWPMPRDSSPVRVALEHAGQTLVLQPGRIAPGGWRFDFRKHLASESQPFDVVATRQVGWGEMPWLTMAAWTAAVAAFLAALMALVRQRSARQRAEELLRLGQVGRLNALGELAAGMAHELNQPLTAVVANIQAARRLLDEEPPELGTARHAMEQAVQQGRRAAEVVGRLRRAVERPDLAAHVLPLSLQQAVRNVLYLLEPELNRSALAADIATAQAVLVLAEPVAVEQIVFNLVTNALQALDQVPASERRLMLEISSDAGQGILSVADTGSGIAPEILPRLFEPFFTTREAGLGLGLSLCETLAQGMGGSLSAHARMPRGAQFVLRLPLAPS